MTYTQERVVLTDKVVQLVPDPDFEDDPFIDTKTGKRKRIAKAPSSTAKRVSKKSTKEKTMMLTCSVDELDRVLPHAEDGEGDLFVFPILHPGEETDMLCTKLEELTADKSVRWILLNSNEQASFQNKGPLGGRFLTGDFFNLEKVALMVCEKLMQLNMTNMILIVDGGQIDTTTPSAKKGDVAKLALKWALLMLKHKDRGLFDSAYSNVPLPLNANYRNLLHDLGRARGELLMHARAKEFERTHDI